MSKETRSAILDLAKCYRKNKPRIEKELQKAGMKADSAVVFSVAVYYDCLDRLAKEE